MRFSLIDLVRGSEERRRLVSNISSLSLLQFFNYLLPLFTVPYLVRVLGPEKFGLLAFATAIVAYFIMLTDYGFNLSATRQISINRRSPQLVSQIFSEVMVTKALLFLLSSAVFMVPIFCFENLQRHWELYVVTYGMVLGQAMFPVWLFQGMESMKQIVYLNLAAKLFFTICIFIFVTEQSDYIVVPLLTSVGAIVIGVASIVIAKKKFELEFHVPTSLQIKRQLFDGWHIFFSSLSISLYTTTTVVILGIFTNNTTVGYFSGAERIVAAAKTVFVPVSQAIYPVSSERFATDIRSALVFLKRALLIMGSVMFMISLSLFVFAEAFVLLLLGPEFQGSVVPLRVMALVPFLVCLSNFFGVQIMINLDFKQAFSRILFFAALFGVLGSIILVPIWGEIGSASITLFVELFVSLAMAVYLLIKLKKVQ